MAARLPGFRRFGRSATLARGWARTGPLARHPDALEGTAPEGPPVRFTHYLARVASSRNAVPPAPAGVTAEPPSCR